MTSELTGSEQDDAKSARPATVELGTLRQEFLFVSTLLSSCWLQEVAVVVVMMMMIRVAAVLTVVVVNTGLVSSPVCLCDVLPVGEFDLHRSVAPHSCVVATLLGCRSGWWGRC